MPVQSSFSVGMVVHIFCYPTQEAETKINFQVWGYTVVFRPGWTMISNNKQHPPQIQLELLIPRQAHPHCESCSASLYDILPSWLLGETG